MEIKAIILFSSRMTIIKIIIQLNKKTFQFQEKHRALAKLAQENAARIAKGEPQLPEDDVMKQFRPLPVPHRLNSMIVSGQINTYAKHMSQFASQSLAKLYLTQGLQNAKEYVKDQPK